MEGSGMTLLERLAQIIAELGPAENWEQAVPLCRAIEDALDDEERALDIAQYGEQK
jgi:hypothetical protein